jgi:deoxyribose-phosphate aldolase
VRTDLSRYIDHTLLRPEASRTDIEALCTQAREHAFKSVCLNRLWVETASGLLEGSDVLVCSVVGFPLGATSSTVKAREAAEAVRAGAGEIDMVLAVGLLKQGDREAVRDDIAAVVQACEGRTVKVILETALLDDEEKVSGCRLSREAGAHFVKTSTGFGPGGATLEDVALMRSTVGDSMGVKASGGIRTAPHVDAFIGAGANRIGTSSGVAIVTSD